MDGVERGACFEDRYLIAGEIGAVLDISPNTAASRYRYALDELRAVLGEHADD